MADEFFDIVNDRDEVIGREARRIVHQQGLWHRAIHVFVSDPAGRIFLQKRSMLKDMAPGLWDSSCSGHVDSGEAYDTAAKRELGEELGLTQEIAPVRWFRVEARPETGWEFVWVYRMWHPGPFELHPDEIECGDWFFPADVTAMIARHPENYAPAFRLIWMLGLDRT